MKIADLVDGALEAPVVSSFSRLGFEARARIDDWDKETSDLTGKVVALTGATSGIGKAAALELASAGATLVLVGRNPDRNQQAVAEIRSSSGNKAVTEFAADMGNIEQVRALAAHLNATFDKVDVLAHNAGALLTTREVSAEGIEATVASQVVGPFLLTSLLLDRLEAAENGRVLTMSSGGMYTAGLTVSQLEMSPERYKGAEQYARAKRAQVTLNEMWADKFEQLRVVFHAMHPGWVDTPGVDASLPTFSKVMGPLLRTPTQGADTLVWLASARKPLESNGEFWLDRRPRSIHRLPRTRKTDSADRRSALWSWVVDASGIDPEALDAPGSEDSVGS